MDGDIRSSSSELSASDEELDKPLTNGGTPNKKQTNSIAAKSNASSNNNNDNSTNSSSNGSPGGGGGEGPTKRLNKKSIPSSPVKASASNGAASSL